jgi:hypothetical protein
MRGLAALAIRKESKATSRSVVVPELARAPTTTAPSPADPVTGTIDAFAS